MDPTIMGRGLWRVALALSALLILFATSFARPARAREGWTLAAFCAFTTSALLEMYGFPLTPYLAADWVLRNDVPLLAHPAGRFWYALLGLLPDPRARWFGISGVFLVASGAALVAACALPRREAHAAGGVPSRGPYAVIRHPQETGFVLMVLGFLFRWPSPWVLGSAPLLVVAYVALARAAERDARAAFGASWDDYARRTPALLPRRRRASDG